MPTYESDDEEPIRRIYTHGALPEIPGSDNAKIAPLRRDLFAQDILNEEDRIRPIYAHTLEFPAEYSPPGSPTPAHRGATTGPISSAAPERSRTPTSSTAIGSDSPGSEDGTPRLAVASPRGILKYRHLTIWQKTTDAMQEISCEYNQQHNLFLQYIQFSLGGVPDPERAGTISPRAVYRTWPGNLELPDQPFWVKYHKFGYSMRVVPYDYAVGRVALLAYISENISISNQLVEWAKKFHPTPFQLDHAQLHYLHDEAAEDTDDEDILDRLLDRPTF
ncbi:hypothetical protein B0H17DRAFT_383689 [Mycena rosella]|nr:hypothetical protein B0H17DRAFT_383689 [Mycena rosella]